MAIKNQDDYFEFHESPQDLFDDPADFQEAIGNKGEANRIRKKREEEPDELFTDEEVNLIRRVAKITWDSLEMPIGSYSREEVFEMVFDAGRILERTENNKELAVVTKFTTLGWDEMMTYIEDIFPSKIYE